MENLIAALEAMRAQIESLMSQLDISAKERRVASLETLTGEADFWSNPDKAQVTMREISRLKAEIDHWQGVQRRVVDALEL
ncbi:MAG: hypothetical protein CUN53_17485, partial [Phototrophicales bacterium]